MFSGVFVVRFQPQATLERVGSKESSGASQLDKVDDDLVAVLENKLAGVAALGECRADAQAQGDDEALELVDQLERRENEDIAALKAVVARRRR